MDVVNSSTPSADRLTANANNATSTQAVATTIGQNYTFTVWLFQDVTATQPDNSVAGLIQLGTATQAFTASSQIQRLTVSFTATGTSTNAIIQVNTLGKSIVVAQAQVEPTSTTMGLPINTTTAAVTATPYSVGQLITYCKDQFSGAALQVSLPTTSFRYTEIHVGNSAGFVPSESTLVQTSYGTGHAAMYAYSATNVLFDNIFQDQPYGIGGTINAICYAAAAAQVTFKNINLSLNGSRQLILDCATTSPVVTVSNCRFDWPQNYNYSIISSANSTKSLVLKNVRSNLYDVPLTLSTLNTTVEGVAAGAASPGNAASDPRWTLGNSADGDTTSYVAVYDNNFHELYTGTTSGVLRLNFTESLSASKPYTVLSGSPKFDGTGKLYFYSNGDSIEFEADHFITGVTGFKNVMPRTNVNDLGYDRTTGFALIKEYAINTGSGYGSYKDLTGANLSAESISATTGFKIKIRLTAKVGMKITSQSSLFVLNETINGQTSGATARVIAIENNNTNNYANTILLDTITGTFAAGETIRQGVTARGTNTATNGFALFPSFTSYLNGIELYTNVNQNINYPEDVRTYTITATPVLTGAEVRIYDLDNVPPGSLGTEISGTENCPGASYSFQTAPNANVWIQVMKSGYKEFGLATSLPDSDQSFSITLDMDSEA